MPMTPILVIALLAPGLVSETPYKVLYRLEDRADSRITYWVGVSPPPRQADLIDIACEVYRHNKTEILALGAFNIRYLVWSQEYVPGVTDIPQDVLAGLYSWSAPSRRAGWQLGPRLYPYFDERGSPFEYEDRPRIDFDVTIGCVQSGNSWRK